MPVIHGIPGVAVFQFGIWEMLILLVIIAVLLLFGPTKLPEIARAVGRAWGEFRKGRMEVEREIRDEFARTEGGEASRDQVLRVARELGVPTEARDLKDVRADIAKAMEHADTPKVVQVAKIMGLAVEGVSAQSLKEQIVRRVGAQATGY